MFYPYIGYPLLLFRMTAISQANLLFGEMHGNEIKNQSIIGPLRGETICAVNSPHKESEACMTVWYDAVAAV